MNTNNTLLGKVLYGFFFVIILPLLLWLWSIKSNHVIDLPMIKSDWGIAIMMAGLVLILWSMLLLIIHGDGLPMNAYPTNKLVRKGPYYIFKHPIYIGTGILLIGASIWLGLASALWLVTPITIMAMVALVLGYEKIELENKFPEYQKPVFFSIPKLADKNVKLQQKIAVVILFYFILVSGNLVVWFLFGNLQNKISIIDFENVPNYLQIIGFLSFLLPISIVFLSLKQNVLREWMISSIIAMGIIFYIALIWPVFGSQYFINSELENLNGYLLITSTLPACLMLLLAGTYTRAISKLKWVIWVIAIIFTLVILINTSSPLINLLITIIAFLISYCWKLIWLFLRDLSEKIANSWKEWIYGPVRIINHAVYIGAGAFLSTLAAGFLLGEDHVWGIVLFEIVVIIFAALWAQIIEGSNKLKRPFGYYGGMVGIIFSSLLVWALGYNVWAMIAIAAVLMPWVQGIGRLRCLANGCCHGKKTPNPFIGIKHFHPRSRVVGISNLKGESLHPTPLYAIIWLFFVGFIQLSLWINGFSPIFILGMYLIFMGLGRFVEEAFRGEVQTPFLFGLRLYQWMAILSIVLGAICTILKIDEIELVPTYGPSIYAGAIVMGVIAFFAMGIDFPKSNMRFSRLV